MSVNIGDEGNIIDLANEFRNVLSQIRLYIEKENEYNENIQILENELLEEESLKKILEDNNEGAFSEIKSLINEFINKKDIESKIVKLDELFINLQNVIDYNNEKLNQNKEIKDIFDSIDNNKLESANKIPIKINEIKEYLKQKGRSGNNYPYNIYKFTSNTETENNLLFEKQLPNDRIHIRGIHLNLNVGDQQFYLANDFATFISLDPLNEFTNALPYNKKCLHDAIFTIYADEPGTGHGTIEVYQLNNKKQNMAIYQKTRHYWVLNDGSINDIDTNRWRDITEFKITEIEIKDRAQNQAGWGCFTFTIVFLI